MTTAWAPVPTRLARNRSTSMPSGNRNKAPASTGVATIRPLWAGSNRNSPAIATPSGPSRTQTMKLRSK